METSLTIHDARAKLRPLAQEREFSCEKRTNTPGIFTNDIERERDTHTQTACFSFSGEWNVKICKNPSYPSDVQNFIYKDVPFVTVATDCLLFRLTISTRARICRQVNNNRSRS